MYHTSPSLFATADSVPENRSETHALDASEQEHNRMISQHTTYHRMMMDDLMKLSTESGSANTAAAAYDPIGIVAGLGTTVANLDASNQQLLRSAANRSEQGKQRATTASNLNAYMQKMGLKLQGDLKTHDALMSQREGFDTMDAALEVSEIMSESQKYAFFVFGAFAIFLLYKTIKHL
jgi:hypothetical protein